MKHLLLTIAIICLTLLPAGAEPYAQIPPPQLVECKSATNCDRDPKHLEAFVEGFYKWYAYSIDLRFSGQLDNYSNDERMKIINEIDKIHEKNMEYYLTPEFYSWRKLARMHYGEDLKNPKYCSPDSEAITCSQDWGKEDLKYMTIHKNFIKKIQASFIVSFSYKHQLYVRLQAHDGFWRLSTVNRYKY